MKSFKELNDVLSQTDSFKSRLVFWIFIDQKLFIEFIESNEPEETTRQQESTR